MVAEEPKIAWRAVEATHWGIGQRRIAQLAGQEPFESKYLRISRTAESPSSSNRGHGRKA